MVVTDLYGSLGRLAANWASLVNGYLLAASREPVGQPSARRDLRFPARASKQVVMVSDGVVLGRGHRISSSKMPVRR